VGALREFSTGCSRQLPVLARYQLATTIRGAFYASSLRQCWLRQAYGWNYPHRGYRASESGLIIQKLLHIIIAVLMEISQVQGYYSWQI
jgi:hypothetical protein